MSPEGEREQKIKEYESVVGLMQDTGQSVWVINGTYVLALTVLLGALVGVVAEKDATQLQLIIAVVGAVVSLLFIYLWWASFARNYAFYNLRIHHARTLEAGAGFSLLSLGARLSKGEEVTLLPDEPIQIPRLAGEGIQVYTRRLILMFGLVFLGLGVAGAYRLNAIPVVLTSLAQDTLGPKVPSATPANVPSAAPLALTNHAQGTLTTKAATQSSAAPVVQPAARAESLYISILEKTNNQLSLWWNPYGVFVGALGLLFTLAAIVVGYAIFRQSRDHREMMSESIAKYERVLDVMVKDRLAQLAVDTEKGIAEVKTEIAAATAARDKDKRSVLEQRLSVMEKQLAGIKSAESTNRGQYLRTLNLGMGSVSMMGNARTIKRTCEQCGKDFDVRPMGLLSFGTTALCPHCGAGNTVY